MYITRFQKFDFHYTINIPLLKRMSSPYNYGQTFYRKSLTPAPVMVSCTCKWDRRPTGPEVDTTRALIPLTLTQIVKIICWLQPKSCYCTGVKVNKSLIKRYFKAHLTISPKWAITGLLVIYDRQTADEKATDNTSENNSVGFSGVDAEFLSSLAKQVRAGRTLSPKQMSFLFKKMPKYWEQLWDCSKNQEATFSVALRWDQNDAATGRK